MTTLLNLKADLEDWLIPAGASQNLAARIPDFIKMAEELHRFGDPQSNQPGLRVKDMLRRARAFGNDTTYLAYPIDYLEMLNFRVIKSNATDGGKIDQVPHESMNRIVGGVPNEFAQGRELEMNAILSSAAEVEMLYYAPFSPLVGNADTNWLLDNAFSCYLYGSLLHAAPYLADDDRIPIWTAAYQQAVVRVQGTADRGRRHKGELKVKMPRRYASP